ncbi:bifunctional allantoicase/(S)-ureidoglycine aminohydrolase [Jannaschia sp. LMIT008]|uniref:bifunctional allantoicase/(S)-ureidoglycine aminohydrolase n=1 Tax=Jannaschia maritima TaxID=3032585 RepID=UPI002812763D|nr:bifunctional allantoicase/(S)-ureidoglycine aminohydrolase [Jannaschia sp. LMIT008]
MTTSDFPGGLPPQTALMTQRAALTPAYALIPRACLSDITTSHLPGWTGMRMWILARPTTGLAETFAHYLLDVAADGGCDRAEPDPAAQGILYAVAGSAVLTVGGADHDLGPGDCAYLPPGVPWGLQARDGGATVHWYRKRWRPADGVVPPPGFVTATADATTTAMPGTDGRWATTRFVDPADMAHDMHVNVVAFQPGATIPFEETHVMEHSIHVLEGKAVYKLDRDWIEMEAGDTAILRAFCPQACYAAGPGPFRYLLYKDVNRHVPLIPGDER